MYLRSTGHNCWPIFLKSGKNFPFYKPLDNLVGLKNQIIFTPVKGAFPKIVVFGVQTSIFLEKIPFSLYLIYGRT